MPVFICVLSCVSIVDVFVCVHCHLIIMKMECMIRLLPHAVFPARERGVHGDGSEPERTKNVARL